MIPRRVTIVMHSMTKRSSNSWTQRNNFSNTLALAILVILLSNAVTMTEQRSISSIYKSSSSSQEKYTAAKVETEHKIMRQGPPSWLIPKITSHNITGKLIRFNEKYPNIIDIKIGRYTMGIFKSVTEPDLNQYDVIGMNTCS
jgi:hypothetical protein